MSQAEYDAMLTTGRAQPRLTTGQDTVHVTRPSNHEAYKAAPAKSVYAEFDVDDAQMTNGGTAGWAILYGPNSQFGRLAAQRGTPLTSMPAVTNLVIIAVKGATL